jgi:hypothetical protein
MGSKRVPRDVTVGWAVVGVPSARERQLALVAQVMLVPEQDHLVLEQRRVDPSGGGRVDTIGKANAVDAGTDMSPELDDTHG